MDKYKKQIEEMIENLKKENPQRNIEFKDGYILDVNGTKLEVSLLDIKEPMEKDDEKTNINKIKILFKTPDGYVLIAEVTEDNEIMLYGDGLEEANLDDKVSLTESNKIELLEDEKGNKERDDEDKPEVKEEEKEERTKSNDRKNWQEMELDREFSESENMRMWLNSKCDVHAEKLYRVPEKSGNGFKYIAITASGEEQELPLSTNSEGRNSMQKIYILNKEGEIEEKDVDSLLLTKSGDHGIATDRADSVAQDHTKSYVVRRTKDGRYLAVEALQKDTRDRESSNDDNIKDTIDDRKSIYDLEAIPDSIDDIEEDKIAEDGITAEEVNIHKTLKEEGFSDREIDTIFRYMDSKKIKLDQAKLMVREERDEEYTGYGQARPH